MNLREIIIYETARGIKPFEIWFESIKNPVARFQISSRIDRIRTGNLGNWKHLGEGLCEFKLKSGAGYRIYYSEIDNVVLLLLCGGDKGSQGRDIRKAREYLKDFKERLKNER